MKKSLPMPIAAGIGAVVLIVIFFALYHTFLAGPPVDNEGGGSHSVGGGMKKPANLNMMTKEQGMQMRNGSRSAGQ